MTRAVSGSALVGAALSALMAEPVWPNVRMCGERGRVEEISLDASRLLRAFVHVNGGPGKFVRPAHSCAK